MSRLIRNGLAALVLLLVLGAVAFAVVGWRPEIEVVATPPARSAFDRKDVEQGAALAAIGNCDVCHTAAGGAFYAGGRPIPTPFGTIYATNVTPDAATGIGEWSEAAFRRALRQGVARDGHHLYPVFPYDHFIDVTDTDAHALYAFVMTRAPVIAPPVPNDLPFPFSWRPALAVWKVLYLRPARFRRDPAQSQAWNRGGYLVEGLAHCGACHTPRNTQGAEQRDQKFAGGSSEGWYAPALNGASPAPVPWTADQLYAYLRHGDDAEHGAPAGPMAPVAHNLARVSDADVRAMAIYVASLLAAAKEVPVNALMAAPQAAAPKAATPTNGAAEIFDGACASCHSGAPQAVAIDLAHSTAVSAPDPRNAIRVVLAGILPPPGEPGPLMPAFAGALTDQQIADLMNYIRARFGHGPAWGDLIEQVRAIRSRQEKS
jgi:mono/diheme cytochrome c family protein